MTARPDSALRPATAQTAAARIRSRRMPWRIGPRYSPFVVDASPRRTSRRPSRLECCGDLPGAAGLPDHDVAVVPLYYLGMWACGGLVSGGVEEVCRASANALVLVGREAHDLRAGFLRAFTDEGDLLDGGAHRCHTLDALVSLSERGVVPADALGAAVRAFG